MVFRISTSGKESVLYSFQRGYDASGPYASLIDVNGLLYSTTDFGGKYGHGTVFSVTTGGKEKVLHSFGKGSDGNGPVAALLDSNGTLYSTTWIGGHGCFNGCGTVFAITP